MRAGILAVGSELLGTDRLDSNSLSIAETLRRYGVQVQRKVVVGDVAEEIAGELSHLLVELDLVLVTGGLGPTADDVTRQATAAALGRALHLDPDLLEELRAKFAHWGMRMPEVNVRQAELIEGARALPNPRGTAPGMLLETPSGSVFLFPGVPAELRGLMRSALEPWLQEHTDGERLETRVLRVACLPESALEERIRPVYEEFGGREISVLASPGDIQIRLSVTGPEAKRHARLEAMMGRLRQVLGRAVYATGVDASLEAVVGELLVARTATAATAESCTGGLVAERLTNVPGSSRYFAGGVVAYSNRLKSKLLGVSTTTLERHGAVSREVVLEMGRGVVDRLEADYGIAVSGVAGPDGGTTEKPVGTVHLAVVERRGEAKHRALRLPGDRRRVRWLASQWSLDLLRRRLFAGEQPS